MKLSSKSRYGLAAVVKMAELCETNKRSTVTSLSADLQISKIYLEQVFSLLKRGGVVISIKGAQGGYRLARPAREITVLDVLSSIETAVFEKTEQTLSERNASIENAMQEGVFTKLDDALRGILAGITVADIANQAKANQDSENHMYYI